MEIVDLDGDQGNVFYLMGKASQLIRDKEPNLDKSQILADMRSHDYEHALEVFTKHFGKYCTLVGGL